VLTLEASDLHDRVRAAVEQYRDKLAELVNAEVDRVLQEIVVERIAAGNGTGPHGLVESGTASAAGGDVGAAPEDVSATKLCSRCRKTKPVDQFRRHRGVCRDCRREEDRERRERHAARRQASNGQGDAAAPLGGEPSTRSREATSATSSAT
jgi:hypothetical protein